MKEKYKIAVGNFSMPSNRLIPLTCPRCGANVPLVDNAETNCRACGTHLLVPDSYRELKKYHKEHQLKLDQLMKKHAELATKTPALITVWLKIASPLLKAFFALYALLGLASLLLLFFACIYMAPLFGINLIDVYGPIKVYFYFGSFLVFFLLMPEWFTEYYENRTGLKKILQASMSAKFNPSTGGTYNCRCCGAEVFATKDVLAVVCNYCGTDNLIALEPNYLTKIRQFSKWQFNKMEDALKKIEEVRESAKLEFKTYAFIGVMTLGALSITGWIFDSVTDNDKPNWGKANAVNEEFFKYKSRQITKEVYHKWVCLKKGQSVEALFPNTAVNPRLLVNLYTDELVPDSAEEYEVKKSSDSTVSLMYRAPYTGSFELNYTADNATVARFVFHP